MQAIGWQGGTVYALCAHLGLDVQEFLYDSPKVTHTGSSYNTGLYWDTNGKEHQKKLQEIFRGNLDYWLGVARCIEIQNQ